MASRSQRADVNIWVKVSQPSSDKISARMVNISQTGCKIECMNVLNNEELLKLEIPGQPIILAKIVWAKSGGGFGCQFETPISEFKERRIIESQSKPGDTWGGLRIHS